MNTPDEPSPPHLPTTRDQDAPPPVPPAQQPLPQRFGRYRVERLLGEGAFGQVFLAHDEELRRPVAIKVPHPERLASPEDVDAYLSEARTLASLDHPHVVPVHDAGRTDAGLCYVVSKFIDGSDLGTRIAKGRPAFTESAAIIASIAEALHHAHVRGLVHRDVKPANILLDTNGRPFLADFGLALKEEDFGRGSRWAGTPAYMSPEQARSQGHHLDGRSDIFSLGVVLYELLAGRRPFRGQTVDELLDQIISIEARPPRQIDDTIPRELERICLQALAKRATERYTTARDMAEDLQHFLDRRESDKLVPADAPSGQAGNLPKARHPLQEFPRAPLVPSHQVPLSIKQAYASLIPVREARQVIDSANAFRQEADRGDPSVTLIKQFRLRSPEDNSPIDFWLDAFAEAGKHGPRMLAALLLIVEDDQFPDPVKQARQALLDYLRNPPQ